MIFLEYLFMFCLFSVVGWIIELIYRSIILKKIVNPGFMTGCVVPLYGFGSVILNIICKRIDSFHTNYKLILLFFISVLVLSILEYVSGYIIKKFFHIRLWDYSMRRFNINGFVCGFFSFIWGISSLIYYYLIFPWINDVSYNFINNKFCLFSLGIFFGIFLIDLFVTIDLLKKLSDYAKSIKKIISLEKIKMDSMKDSTRKGIWNAIYPYISTNKFLKDKIKKK